MSFSKLPTVSFIVFLVLTITSTFGDEATTSSVAKVAAAIQDLRSGDAAARRLAKLKLLRPENAAALQALGLEIMPLVNDYETSEESAEVIACLPVSPDVRQRLLSSPNTPTKVRAKLGDTAAERTTIAKFQDANHLAAKYAAGLELLYVGSTAANTAFAKALESPRIMTSVDGNQVSVVQILLRCYGQMHPEEPLFSTQEQTKHITDSPEQFRAEEHQSYLRKIEAYFLQKQGMKLAINPPFLLGAPRPARFIDLSK